MKYAEQILFIVVFGTILYFSLQHTNSSEQNYKRGLAGVCFVYVAEGTLKSNRGIFLRPNEAFWRGVLRFCLIYMYILVFLAFQNSIDARNIFKHLYPELGRPVTEEVEAIDDNCQFEWNIIFDNLDQYVAIHLINWFCASLIVRDAYILHTWSILDELIELSGQHIMPHFKECWWDRILLDLMIANTTSITIGLIVCKLFNLQPYDWLGRKGSKGFSDWKIWRCQRRFGSMLVIWFVIISNFLCGFFLINSLWIPHRNLLNIYRLLVWFLLSNQAFKEIYTDIDTWGTQKRIQNPISGKVRWIIFFICFTEILITLKFISDAGNIQDNPTPLYIIIPWIVLISSCLIYYLYLRLKSDHTRMYPIEYYQKQKSIVEKQKQSFSYQQQMVKNDNEKSKSQEVAKQKKKN